MRKTISCATFLLVLSVPLWYGALPGLFHKEEATAYIAGLLFLLTGASTLLTHKRVLSILDVTVMLFFLYMGIHYALHDGTRNDPSLLCKWIGALGGYTLARNIPNKRVLGYAILGAGVLEAITTLLQSSSIITTNNPYFDVTGHFNNPGPLGGFLAIGWTIGFTLLLERKTNDKCWLAGMYLALVLLSVGLILADSRAAWFSAICGTCCFLVVSRRIRFNKRTACLLLGASVCLLVVLYLYRPTSAQARLFIWRTSSYLVTDSPLFGHGIGSFQWIYMYRQAHYFETHPSAPEQMVADNTGFPYNETLHATVETGVTGFVLICAIFIIAWRRSATDQSRTVIRPAIIVWLLFAQFSYPTDSFPLLLSVACLLGCLNTPPVTCQSCGKTQFVTLLLLWGIVSWSCFSLGHFYHQASSCLSSLHSKHNTSALHFIEKYYKQLKNNVTFNATYHFWLARHSDNPDDQDTAEDIIPTSESYCLLGDYYQRIGLPHCAERAYQTASNMVPTRIMPLYKLWQLYLLYTDTTRAIETARRIIAQPVKVNNSLSINTKRKAREYLKQSTNQSERLR